MGAVRKVRQDLHLSSRGVTRFEMGSDVGRIVRAAGVAKDHERINFFFGRTHQDGTTVAACKFDGRVGQLQHWRCWRHTLNERRWNDPESLR